MNGIMGMINLLKNTELTPDQRDYADAVSQCANDLLTIINDLLDLSQIDAGRLSLSDDAFDMHESVRAVVKLLRLRASGKSLALSYEIDPNLPTCVSGDSVRFRQILTNPSAPAVETSSLPEGLTAALGGLEERRPRRPPGDPEGRKP